MKHSLITILTVACSLLFVISFIFVAFGYTQIINEEKHQEASSGTLLSIYNLAQDKIINDIQQNLIVVSKNPYLINSTTDQCNDLLSRLLSNNNYYANIIFVKPDGNISCGALINNAQKTNQKNESFFKNAISNPTFSGGSYQAGGVTGQPTILYGYPVYKSDSSLAGVVAIALDLSWLDDYYKIFDFPQNTSVTVIDSKGAVVHEAGNTNFELSQISTQKILNDVVSDIDVVRDTTVLESNGVNRRHFFKNLVRDLDNPLTIIVSVDKERTHEKFYKVIKNNLNYFIIIIATSFISSTLIYYYITRRSKES